MEEGKIKPCKIEMPYLQINSGDIRPIEDYNALESLLGGIVIVRNKLNPDIILVGTLIKKTNSYRVNGTSFKKEGSGRHHIIGNIYDRDATAEYGLEIDEFEKREPHYIHDNTKADSLTKDLKEISSLPHIAFGRPKQNHDRETCP